MSYTPNTWKKGDVVTSDKLNNIEGGVSAAQIVYVTLSESSGTYSVDVSYDDMITAIEAGSLVVLLDGNEYAYLYTYSKESGEECIIFSKMHMMFDDHSVTGIEGSYIVVGGDDSVTYEDGQHTFE